MTHSRAGIRMPPRVQAWIGDCRGFVIKRLRTCVSIKMHSMQFRSLDPSSGQPLNANAVIHFLDTAPQGATLLMYTTLEDLNRSIQRIHLSTHALSDQIGRFRTIYILKNQNGAVKKPREESEVKDIMSSFCEMGVLPGGVVF